MVKTLPPQHLTPGYYADIERQLLAVFSDLIFKPVAEVLKAATAQAEPKAEQKALGAGPAREIRNAGPDDALRAALRSGRVQYARGVFSGAFGRHIVDAMKAMGGKLDKLTGTYRAAEADVPGWVKAEAASYAQRAKATHELIKAKLDDLQTNLSKRLAGRGVDAVGMVEKVDDGMRTASKGVEVGVPPLTKESRARLAADYTQNMELWVKKFTEGMIVEMRETVEENANEGYRFDRLITKIKGRYGVTQSKARFLARQETGLFMSKFRQQRFGEAGVKRYRWNATRDSKTRHDHRKLNGQIFYYSQPPVVDSATGRRANPGEDFNCRCVDEPVLESTHTRTK